MPPTRRPKRTLSICSTAHSSDGSSSVRSRYSRGVSSPASTSPTGKSSKLMAGFGFERGRVHLAGHETNATSPFFDRLPGGAPAPPAGGPIWQHATRDMQGVLCCCVSLVPVLISLYSTPTPSPAAQKYILVESLWGGY
eukprot:scaffold1894_cov120-Isochrysis_galbana.AAC.5